MAFPQSKLDSQLHFKFDGVNWTDVTQWLYAREDGGVTITYGRQDWGERIDAATCTFLLDNRDLRFSPRNPLGPYYGQIGRNTPVRFSVNQGSTYLDLPGGTGRATTPDSAALSLTGDLDIRVDYQFDEWESAASPTELCGKWSASVGGRSWMLVNYQNRLALYWSNDGTAEIFKEATVPMAIPGNGRLGLRATLDVNNGAGGNTVTFYTAPTIAGPWTQLGDPVVTAGTTSVFDNTQALDVGAVAAVGFPDPVGKCFGFQLRSTIDGTTTVANPDFTAQTAGAGSFVDGNGNTWSMFGTGSLSNRKVRFTGEIPEWPVNQDPSGNDIYIEVQAAGRLRRTKANTQPLQSTLRRRIPSYSPTAYWPMEEGSQALNAQGIPDGVNPLTISTVNWAANDTLISSDPLPTLSATSTAPCVLQGVVPQTGAAPTSWETVFMYRMDVANATKRTFMTILSTGTVRTWVIQTSGTGTDIIGRDGEGANIFSQGVVTGAELYNTWVRVHLKAAQSGGNVNWSVLWVPVGGVGETVSNSFAGTVGRPTGFAGPPAGYSTDLDGMALGHLSAWPNNTTADLAYQNSDIAWSGETARDRFRRLVTEEAPSLDLTIRTDPLATHAVGGQRTQQLYEVLQDTADVDGGILCEHRERNGLLYRDRLGLYNQIPRCILRYPTDLRPPLKPADDDQATKNDVTVSRTSGGSRRQFLASGRMSVNEFPNGVGPYPDDISLPLVTDDDADDIAAWRLHLGTVDEARYPQVNVWLQRQPSILDPVLSINVGDRVQISTPPAKLQYDIIDLMVQGYTEYISQFRWEFTFNCTPASPWDVGNTTSASTSASTDQWSWADTTSSDLAEALTTTETDVDILTAPSTDTNTSTDTALWTPSLSDYPFLLSVGGETLRADAPGNFTNSNPYFDVNSTGWSGINSSVARSTSFVITHPQAIASLRVTPTGGGPTTAEIAGPTTAAATVNPSSTITSGAWVFSPTGWAAGVETAVDWYNSGGYISTTVGTASALVAGQWKYIEMTGTAPSNADRCAPKVVQVGSPTSADVYYVWAVRVCRTKNSAVYDNFGRTDTDTWTTSDSKNTWTNVGTAADYDVLTGFGRHINTAASAAHHSVTAAPNADGDLYVDIAVAALSTGASQFAGGLLRYADVDNLYEARVEFTTANAINLTIRKRVATVETQLGTFADGTATAGGYIRIRFKIAGTSLKAKIWNPAIVGEPYFWAIEVTDSSLSAAGSVGVKSVRNAGNTNVNAITQFDNFDLVNPQSFACTRSYNGVVKAQSAGADIALRYPATAAL